MEKIIKGLANMLVCIFQDINQTSSHPPPEPPHLYLSGPNHRNERPLRMLHH